MLLEKTLNCSLSQECLVGKWTSEPDCERSAAPISETTKEDGRSRSPAFRSLKDAVVLSSQPNFPTKWHCYSIIIAARTRNPVGLAQCGNSPYTSVIGFVRDERIVINVYHFGGNGDSIAATSNVSQLTHNDPSTCCPVKLQLRFTPKSFNLDTPFNAPSINNNGFLIRNQSIYYCPRRITNRKSHSCHCPTYFVQTTWACFRHPRKPIQFVDQENEIHFSGHQSQANSQVRRVLRL